MANRLARFRKHMADGAEINKKLGGGGGKDGKPGKDGKHGKPELA